MNLIFSYSHDTDRELGQAGHIFLGAGADANGSEVHIFLNKDAALAGGLTLVETGLVDMSGADDQSLLQALASNLKDAFAQLDTSGIDPVPVESMTRNLNRLLELVTPDQLTVQLTYFKASGKYYASGEYQTDLKPMYEIFAEVRQLRDAGDLPGLCQGSREWNIHVDVPGHKDNYPAMILL